MGYHSKVLNEQQLAAALAVVDDAWRTALFQGVAPPGSNLSSDTRQLIAEIGACTEARTERFAQLLTTLPEGTEPFVMGPILVGLASSKELLPSDLLVRVARRCHEVPGRPLGVELVRLIEVHSKGDIPREVLELLSWYAVEATRQMGDGGRTSIEVRDKEDEWQLPDHYDGQKHQGNPDWNGSRIVRGVAAGAIGLAIVHDAERLAIVLPTLEKLAGDRSTSVRAKLARSCCNLYKPHPQVAMRLMLRLTETAGLEAMDQRLRDTILSTDSVRNFLAHLNPEDYPTIQPIVERCSRATGVGAMTAAAQTAGAAATLFKNAQEVCERSLLDTVETRKAAAIGLANALTSDPESEYAMNRISRLLFDDDAPTREFAAGFVHFLKPKDLQRSLELVRVFLVSPVFAEHSSGYSMQLYPAVLGASDLEYGLALAFYRQGDEATGEELAKRAIERNDDVAITAKCRELLAAEPARIKNGIKAPWEEPGFVAPVEKLPPVPRWREKYGLKEAAAAPEPKAASPRTRAEYAKASPLPRPKSKPTAKLGWKGLLGIFFVLFAMSYWGISAKHLAEPPSASTSLLIAVAGTLMAGLMSYLQRAVPRLAGSWIVTVAGVVLLTALVFAWVWLVR